MSPSATNELASPAENLQHAPTRNIVASPALAIFPARREQQRTVCVLGAPRGGTSMVAGILRKLGLFMGADIDEANNEDRGFLAHGGTREIFLDPGRAEEKLRYIASSAALVSARNAEHDVWGWKDPLAAFYIRDLNPHVRNPFFIFVTRDPGAIAQRERIEEGVALRRRLLAYMKATSEAYTVIADFLAQRARPTLLVSYERALRASFEVGHAIAEFVGLTAPADYDSWLEAYVSPDRPDASISARPLPHAAGRAFASTPTVQIFVEESLRVRREGGDYGVSTKPGEIGAIGDRLYSAGVELLNSGEYKEAQNRALAILNLFTQQIPALSDGPIGLVAEDLAGGGAEPVYPDLVCGACYLLGMSSLLLASGQQALIYFWLAERMMRRRLIRQLPGSILSEANFWMCLFHKGVAAKAVQRKEIVDEVIHDILAAASDDPPNDLALLAGHGLVEVARRTAAELANQ